MIYTSNPSTGRLSREDHKFKASVGYIAKPKTLPKKKEPKTCNRKLNWEAILFPSFPLWKNLELVRFISKNPSTQMMVFK
jgi:hypothetical protein